MAQTRQSHTTKLPNGNRVTVTTGYNRGGYYRTVTVRRPDGTSDSRTDRKNVGFLNTGLLDVSGGYSNDIPGWARGPSRSSPATRNLSPTERLRGIVVLVVLVGIVVAIVAAWNHFNHSAYRDGRSWALTWRTAWTIPQPFPGCKHSYMTTSQNQQIEPPGGGADVSGAGEPNDNYAQWRAGCESARSSY